VPERNGQPGGHGEAIKLVPITRSAPRDPTLNLTDGLREAARDVCVRVPELTHVRLDAVHFTIFHSRAASRILTYARCYPLPQGMKRRGRHWYALTPVYTPQGVQARYILSFAWSRFWTLSPRDRLETLVHELYHISPEFDGEARSFEVGGWHGHGREWFDNIVRDLTDRHLPLFYELEHPVLALSLGQRLRVSGERLRKPHWVESFRSL
jgi:predicted metallopeptidase